MEAHQLILGERLGSLQQSPSALVHGGRQPFLLVRQGQDAER